MRPHVLVVVALLPVTACAPQPVTPAPDASHGHADDIAYYTCPMHPSVQQPGPGTCPICGMPLTPVTQAERASGAVRVDATRRSRFGIALEAATVRTMGETLRLPAVVAWDADALEDVTVRASGWVQHVSGAPGDAVRAGTVLLTLFSPDLVAAQDDLLRATADAQRGDAGSVARRDAARLRLRRLGVAAKDLDAMLESGQALEAFPIRAPRSGVVLERTVVDGAMVSPGQTLYRLANPSRIWVEGALPEDRLGAVVPGQAVGISAEGLDGPLRGTVARVLPQLDATTRTARVRVRVRNAGGTLRPDQWATLTVALDARARLAVPESAVLYTGPRRVVFVDSGDDLLTPRDVVTGIKADGYVEIVAGLSAGERVVRAGTFLVAADSRLTRGGAAGAP